MANNFSGDSNCVALWRFESGAMTTDSKGTNTLTASASAPTEDTADYKEGGCCADFELSSSQRYSIDDADLSSSFPLKSGASTPKMSFCFWFKPEGTYGTIIGKGASGARSLGLVVDTKLTIRIGISGGSSYEVSAAFNTNFAKGRWYHCGVTLDDSDKSYRMRIWDDTAGALLDSDTTGTFTNNINIESSTFYIGWGYGIAGYVDGKLDEVVVFNDILTVDEIDAIRAGTYGASSLTFPPLFTRQQNTLLRR